jgi:hypothetical protein
MAGRSQHCVPGATDHGRHAKRRAISVIATSPPNECHDRRSRRRNRAHGTPSAQHPIMRRANARGRRAATGTSGDADAGARPGMRIEGPIMSVARPQNRVGGAIYLAKEGGGHDRLRFGFHRISRHSRLAALRSGFGLSKAGVAASSGRSFELSVSMVHSTKAPWDVCGVQDIVGKPLCNNDSFVRQLDTRREEKIVHEYEHQDMIIPLGVDENSQASSTLTPMTSHTIPNIQISCVWKITIRHPAHRR